MTINRDSTTSAPSIKYIDKAPDKVGGFVAQRGRTALPELLAPAGSPKALAAAIAAGADAVYFALPDFNARINADNFTKESFREGVELCHQNGVKAYITLNTQIYDREASDFLSSALFAYKAGVDAAIVGDLGGAALLKKHIPDLELHASTQLSGHNAAAGAQLASLGFTRMVCAREMSLRDIKTYTSTSPIEAEIFIHGALCVSHSGQCLFSSLVGGRSGNRGLCAQPCRLPYKNERGDTGYPLSLKDMCIAEHIPKIIESGVASLKVEGRMKPAEYVFGVVSIYRRLLDEGRAATKDEMSALAAIFSRGGFTDAYLTENISHKMLGVRSEKDKELSRSSELNISKAKSARRIGIVAKAYIKKDEPMRLSLLLDKATETRLSRAISISVSGDVPLLAQSRPIDDENARKNLSKFGSTPFSVTELDIELDGGLMVPVSSLNALRRDACDALSNELLSPYRDRESFELDSKALAKSPAVMPKSDGIRRTAHFTKASQIPQNAKGFFDIIFLSAREFRRENLSLIAARGVNGIALPPVIFDSEAKKLEEHLALAKELKVEHAMVCNLGHISLAKRFEFKLFGGFRLNASNSETAALITERLGFERIILSPELKLPRVRAIAERCPSAVTVYGRIPLMIMEKCAISELYPCGYAISGGRPAKSCAEGSSVLIDRTGARFPILREFDHRNIIYNSLPTYMADKLDTLPPEELCARHFIFSSESESDAHSVIECYISGVPSASPVRRIGV